MRFKIKKTQNKIAMVQKDLIKKLENIALPEIELQSHKLQLKSALLNSKCFKKRTPVIWGKLVPLGLALSFAIVFAVFVINPKLMEAKAMEIIKKDSQVQRFIKENGAVIKEVKIKGGKGYVLLSLSEPKVLQKEKISTSSEMAFGEKVGPQFLVGSIVKVNLRAKKVESIKNLTENDVPFVPLTKEEKAKAIEIIKKEPEIKEMVPPSDKTKIIVKPIPSLKLRLQEDDGKIKVSPEPAKEKRANVILKLEDKQRAIMVNLTQEKAEKVIEEK